jgi:hypothetical protein
MLTLDAESLIAKKSLHLLILLPNGIKHSTSILGLLALGVLLPGNEILTLTDEALNAIEQRAETETPLPDADGVDEEVDEDPVGDAEGKEDSEVCE